MNKYGALAIIASIILISLLCGDAAGQDKRAIGEKAIAEASTLQNKGDKASLVASIAKYEETLPIWRELGDKRAEYGTLANIGGLRRVLGEAERSLEYYEQALIITRDLNDKELECNTLLYEGMSYDVLGNPRRQLEVYAQALPLAKEIKNQTLELSVLAATGVVYHRLGDFQKAISFYDQTLPFFRASGNKQAEMSVLANMGAIFFTLGDYPRSLDVYELALPLSRQLKLEQNEATILSGFGYAHLKLNDSQKALDFFNQALEIKKRVGDRIGEALTLTDVASVHLARNEPQTALDLHLRALEIQRELKLRRNEGNSLGNIGKIYIDLRDHQKAFEYASQALPIKREVGDLNGEGVTLHNLAWIEHARGNENEALAFSDKAIQIVESIRASLGSQSMRESFFAATHDLYELRVDILMSLQAKTPDAGFDALALQTAERARARSLLDLLSEAKADIRKDADKGLMDQEQELRKQIKAKDDIRSRISDRSKAETLDQEIRSLTLKYEDVLAEIRLKNPRYAAITQPRASSLTDIQKMLDPDTLLLEYSLGLNKSYLWVVSQNSIKTFVLPKRTEIEDKARSFYSLVSKSESVAEAKRAAKELGSMLLDPAASELADRRLVIVTDGVLGYIPFSALTTSKSSDPLIAGHEVVYLPSASTLAALREENSGRPSASKTIAVIADPVFNATDTRVIRNGGAQSPVSASETLLTKATREAGFMSVLPRLPGTRSEATKILSFVPEGERKSSMDFDASISTVMDPDLGRYRIIHFATHGLLNSHHPELSGIVLSLVDKNGKPQEGFLRLNDIFNLKLPADLVVLSACQTALGKEVRGEGLIGLTRGFMYAGARRVVASQWAVDDEATSELMRSFYQRMLGDKKLRPSAALREAQLSLLKTKRFNAPYFWSAFAIQGDWK